MTIDGVSERRSCMRAGLVTALFEDSRCDCSTWRMWFTADIAFVTSSGSCNCERGLLTGVILLAPRRGDEPKSIGL